MTNLVGFDQPELTDEEEKVLYYALTTQASDYLTLCEQLRFVYDTVYNIEDKAVREDITKKLLIAFNMAKKMNARLAYYKRKYNNDRSGSKGSNLIRLTHAQERELIRANRPIL